MLYTYLMLARHTGLYRQKVFAKPALACNCGTLFGGRRGCGTRGGGRRGGRGSGGGACDGGRCFSGCGGASPVTLLKFAAGKRCKHRVGSLDLQRSTAAMHQSGRGVLARVRVCLSRPKILSGTTQHTARLTTPHCCSAHVQDWHSHRSAV